MIIAVDFDGTCVEHEFPTVGPDVPGAAEWLKKFVAAGARLILWTMRSDGWPRAANQTPLSDAVAWFVRHGIPLHGVNENPTQREWTASPKAFADVYIDDAAACCPLLASPRVGGRPMVDWAYVGPDVLARIQRQR